MNQKMLSICIPTYNRSNILDITLANIVSQDISKVEVIISDNASTDETYQIVRKYESFGIKYFCNSKNLGMVYNFIKSMELATSDYLILSSDEDDVNIGNIIASISEHMSLKLGLILGTIQWFDGEIYRGYKTKIRSKSFLSFYSLASSVGHLSGIVFTRNRIDFIDLWKEFNSSSSYGLLDLYPHVYIFNRILLENDIATDSRFFARLREVGICHQEQLNDVRYFHPFARYEQLKKILLFLSMYSSFNFIEYKMLTTKFLRGFIDSVTSYKKLDKETKNYFSIDIIENIDLKIYISDSINNLIETKQIMLIDKWLLDFSKIVRYFYKLVSKSRVK